MSKKSARKKARNLVREMRDRARYCDEMFLRCASSGKADVAESWDRKAGEARRWLEGVKEIARELRR